MKAIFSPGPSYSDPRVREYAGWVRILDLYKEGLEELGYEVLIPHVDPELIDQSSTVSKILSYDIVAAQQIPGDADVFLGPPGYSLCQLMKLKSIAETKRYVIQNRTKCFLYVFNNADWWRDQQLTEEYKKFNQPYDLSPAWRWINRTALEMCNHVIACSPWVKMTHAKVVPEKKISIAFWGVDSKKFHPPEVEPPGFNVLFVGGDPIRKGLYYLMRALDDMKDYKLWIIGCTPLEEFPSNWKQFGMVPHVDMTHIYQQCHVLVCPTLEDGIALCVQEGMASGLPVITSPETSEVFEHGISGFRVGYRNVQEIREAIINLKDNPEARRKMSSTARKKAMETTWGDTKEVFKSIIKERIKCQ